MENSMNGAAAGGAMMIITLLWLAVYLGFFVWYLWSMARLLSRIGFANWTGWVPVWNEWNLLVRGGYPGWIAVLMVVPLANLVFVVVRIMAVHRVNTEFGKGAGFTVLGALIAPLWATLLGNAISPQSQLPSAGAAQTGYANPYAPAPHGVQPGVRVQHMQGSQGYGQAYGQQQSAPQSQQPQPHPYQSQPQQPPQPQGRYGQAAQYGGPAAPGQYPYAQQAPGQQTPGSQPQARPDQAGGNPFAPAQPGHDPSLAAPPPQVPQQGQQQGAPQQTPWEQIVQVPPPPGASQEQTSAGTGSGVENLPPVNDPAHPNYHVDPTPSNTWGLSATIGREFHRLAAEDVQAPPSTPLTPTQSQPPFEWPTDRRAQWQRKQAEQAAEQSAEHAAGHVAEQDDDAPLPPVPPEALDPLALPQADPGPQQMQPAPPAPPITPAPPTAPAPPVASAQVDEPNIFDQAPPIHPAARSGEAARADDAAEPIETSLDELFDLGGDAEADDDDLDRTIVAPRPMRQKWALYLTDGHAIELPGVDVVIGRKPAALEGATPVAISDPSRTLSKSHARLRFSGESWTIEDLGSTNGIALLDANGSEQEIEAHTPMPATEQLIIGTLEVSLRRVE